MLPKARIWISLGAAGAGFGTILGDMSILLAAMALDGLTCT